MNTQQHFSRLDAVRQKETRAFDFFCPLIRLLFKNFFTRIIVENKQQPEKSPKKPSASLKLLTYFHVPVFHDFVAKEIVFSLVEGFDQEAEGKNNDWCKVKFCGYYKPVWGQSKTKRNNEQDTNQHKELVKIIKGNCPLSEYYYSDCFIFVEYIATTCQGFTCVASKVDIEGENKEDLRKHLQSKHCMNMRKPRLMKEFNQFPSKCFVQCCFQSLVDSQFSALRTVTSPKCILRETQILRRLSVNCTNSSQRNRELCSFFVDVYILVFFFERLHKQVRLPLANIWKIRYLNGTDTERMNVVELFEKIVYPGGLDPIWQFAEIIKRTNTDPTKPFPSDQRRSSVRYKRWDVICYVFLQIVRIVKWLHEQHVAHLNISLQNFMIVGTVFCGTCEKPELKLVDFGFAQDFAGKTDNTDQKQYQNDFYDQYIGNYLYMAPEVIFDRCIFVFLFYFNVMFYLFVQVQNVKQHKRQYDPYAADLWSVGICLWFMIFKEHPFVERLDCALIEKEDYLWNIMQQQQLLPMVTKECFGLLSNKI
ncbi:unc-51-like kinase 3 [Reticulomyxa filosa]|uniref:Unc-51-like kinase 3 n=1 Tax=Reticulomyxa filosa TaxID=46433 RepID=X6NU27_RETFI|nr:unc-51-like kinase 3 [Reticulomyxa filosa]|eukprot:ETO29800.1 unc-51-like kinase 3 [Reticulomyxa filosa]